MVVVGSVNADLLARVARRPGLGETVIGQSLTVSPGGKGANQALAAARTGADVALVGAVGDDEYAAGALSLLRDSDTDLSAVASESTSTGVAVITVGPDGDNSIIVIPGANGTVGREAVARHAGLIAGAAVVVVQMEIPRDGVEEAARLATGRLVVNYAPVVPIDPDVLRRADPLVVNEHEAAAAASLLASGSPDAAPLAVGTEADCAQALIEAGVRSVAITLGERGALICDGPGRPIVPIPAIPVQAVDTTGAGDAFVGALAAALADGFTLEDAAGMATSVAAYSVQRPGAQASYPSVETTL